MIHITFHKNSAEPNRVDKSAYLTAQTIMTGVLREETSIINPVILVESNDFPNYNYCYITEFNRYYYIADIISVRNGLWELSLSVDVLMTYNAGILKLNGFIERSQSLHNDRLIDKKRIVEQGYDIESTEITNDVFTNSQSHNSDYADFDLKHRYIVNGYKIGVTVYATP